MATKEKIQEEVDLLEQLSKNFEIVFAFAGDSTITKFFTKKPYIILKFAF